MHKWNYHRAALSLLLCHLKFCTIWTFKDLKEGNFERATIIPIFILAPNEVFWEISVTINLHPKANHILHCLLDSFYTKTRNVLENDKMLYLILLLYFNLPSVLYYPILLLSLILKKSAIPIVIFWTIFLTSLILILIPYLTINIILFFFFLPIHFFDCLLSNIEYYYLFTYFDYTKSVYGCTAYL